LLFVEESDLRLHHILAKGIGTDRPSGSVGVDDIRVLGMEQDRKQKGEDRAAPGDGKFHKSDFNTILRYVSRVWGTNGCNFVIPTVRYGSITNDSNRHLSILPAQIALQVAGTQIAPLCHEKNKRALRRGVPGPTRFWGACSRGGG